MFEIKYEISDDNPADPRTVTYKFFVTVTNACAENGDASLDCEQSSDASSEKQSSQGVQKSQFSYFQDKNETKKETFIPIWHEEEYSKRPEYASATVIEVIPV